MAALDPLNIHYNTRSSNLFSIFWGDRIESYKITLDGKEIPGFFHIGQGHVFTSSHQGDQDPDKGCVELVAVDNESPDEPAQSLLINSYYDEPSVRDQCQTPDYKIDHTDMFKIIDCIAYEIELPHIKLVDGSRKMLPGCPWNLRILNRLLHPEKTTFYEKFGFRTKTETIPARARGSLFPRDAYQFLSESTKEYMKANHLSLVKDLLEHMYAKCNDKVLFEEYASLEEDIITALELSGGLSPGDKENTTYIKEVNQTHRCSVHNHEPRTITFRSMTGGKKKISKRKGKNRPRTKRYVRH
jgi:hypothetical protein